jgi:DNA polymerase IV
MPKRILHLDLDAFYCAVEELQNPSLQGQPFVVGWYASERGVVLSASYAARKWGIHSAMPMARAIRLLPELVIVRPRHNAYQIASGQVMEKLFSLSPFVEQISIDEAFVDISDMQEPSIIIAKRLQAAIRAELGLPCSIGIASNKLLAKTATDVGKDTHRANGPPYAILEVPDGKEAEFLEPLSVKALWGVGPKTAGHLETLGIRTIGDLSRFPEKLLVDYFGKMGKELVKRARGIDNRTVISVHESKSISQERTFERDVREKAVLLHTLHELAQNVGFRLRQEKLAGTTIRLKARWSDFTTLTRQLTLKQPTDQDNVIYETACLLFDRVWKRSHPVRLLGIGVSGLGPPIRQLNLWEHSEEREQRLLEALDTLRHRFGNQVVKRGIK